MDPFFTANQRGPLSGGALGYFRDLHETYKQLPKQSSAARQTIQNATNNRANEQTMIESILASNRDLEDEVAMLREDFGHAALTVMQQRQKLSQLNSKLLPNTEDVSSKSGSDRGSKSVRIHEHEKPDRGESEAGNVRVPGDVLPSVHFYQIQVDPAVVTNLRDDRTPWAAKTGALDCQECGIAKSTNSMGLKEVYETTKRVFHDEVINSPGVRLVAHAIE